MTTLAWGAAISLFAAVWGILWLMRRDTLRRGKIEQEASERQEMLDDVKKALDARDRLRNDAGYAGRLRNRFLRKP